MKKNLITLFTVFMTFFAFVGCQKEDGLSLKGTKWSYTDTYAEDGVQYIVENYISFTSSTNAVYGEVETITAGNESQTYNYTSDYTYQLSGNLVVMTPLQAGNAYLEGEISSNIKMVVTNVSYGEVIGTFYKK